MLGVFFTVYSVSSRHIEQAAIDGFAACWRSLHHEHGEHIEVNYVCDRLRAVNSYCRLQIATCPELTVYQSESDDSEAKTFVGSDDFLDFTMEFIHVGRKFHMILKDHFQQGIMLSGQIGTAARAQKRQLSVINSLNNIGQAVDPHWKGFAASEIFGLRRDCVDEDCPSRWTDCWAGAGNSMMQIQVFLVMDSTFCGSFKSTASCEQYTFGMFADTNLLYEEQMGISLRPAILLPPDAFDKYWPSISRAKEGDQVDGSRFLDTFSKLSCGDGDSGAYFQSVIGRAPSFFGLFHIIVGQDIAMVAPGKSVANNILGLGRVGSVCTCSAVGWTRYVNDRPNSETWGTFAHEIAHNFGGTHYFDHHDVKPGVTADAGILGYGDGTVAGRYAFSQVNKQELCSKVQQILADNSIECFSPYFGIQERDPRFGEPYYVVFATFIALLVVVAVCLCLFVANTYRHTRLANRYRKLREIHRSDVKVLKQFATSQDKVIKAARGDLMRTEQALEQAYVDQTTLADEAVLAETLAIEKAEELNIVRMVLKAEEDMKHRSPPPSIASAPTTDPGPDNISGEGRVSRQVDTWGEPRAGRSSQGRKRSGEYSGGSSPVRGRTGTAPRKSFATNRPRDGMATGAVARQPQTAQFTPPPAFNPAALTPRRGGNGQEQARPFG